MDKREILDHLTKMNLLEYGATFTAEMLRTLAGINLPETGTYQDYKEAALEELKVVSFIRDELLKHGKYMKQDGEAYRVLLPSENEQQAKRMMSSARRKCRRADLLRANTPKDAVGIDTSAAASHTLHRSMSRSDRRAELMR